MDNIERLENLISSLKKEEDVLSIGYIGSLAKKFDLSTCKDVDLMVILGSDKAFEREIYVLDNLEFDISYISFEEIERQINKKTSIWLKAISDYRVIYYKNQNIIKKIEKIKKNIDDFKNKYDKISDLQNLDHIKFLRYDITSKLECLLSRKSDLIAYNHMKNSFILDLINLYFEINNMIIPKVKKQIGEIRKTDEIFYNMLEEYYRNQIDDERFLFTITDHVLKGHGGRLYEFEKGYYPVDR